MIHRSDVRDTDRHEYATEASTVGLAPGTWPDQIPTDLGNGQPLRKVAVIRNFDSGEIEHVTYAQQAGLELVRIFND